MDIYKKLFTHEDNFLIHKSLGLYCLGNYIYQFYNYFVYNHVNLNLITLAPHILLHLSTFIFKVLPVRPIQTRLNMFIWEELRLHSMIFAYRACFSILLPKYNYIICLLTLILADIVTINVGTNGVSTVRGSHENIEKRNIYKKLIGSFFSISQIGATLICFQKEVNPILVFATLIPIQTSAFGMTLLRKNIITKDIWSIIYSIELLLVYVVWYKEYQNLNVLWLSIPIYFLRKLNISKYLIWTSYYFL
jgi:hypothetical protein